MDLRRWTGTRFVRRAPTKSGEDVELRVTELELPHVLWWHSHVQPVKVTRFPHSVNVSLADSDLRVQLQTDPRYAPFVERASSRDVLGLSLPVAAVA